MGTSQGRDALGVISPADTVLFHDCFCDDDTWISQPSLPAFVPNRMSQGNYVCMLNCSLLGDGDTCAATYHLLSHALFLYGF